MIRPKECDACKEGRHEECLGAPRYCICGYWGHTDKELLEAMYRGD